MVKILIVDDHKIFRESLRSLLETKSKFQVIADAADGQSGVLLTKKLQPDIVIMDISMKGLNGIEAVKQIIKKKLTVKVIMLSMHSDKRFVVEAIRAGVSGYLLKECAYEELIKAIEVVLNDNFYLSPNISNIIVKDYLQDYQGKNKSIYTILTSRERQVLQLMSEGKSTKEIASILEISIKTIETYRLHIMDKLDIHSVAQLTKYAIREGLTSLE